MASTNRLSPIPQPPTKPVVGNMLSLDSSAPVQNLARLAKELGPIFWLDMMGAPLVVVSGHDLVDELSDEKRFDKAVRGALRCARSPAMGCSPPIPRSRTGARRTISCCSRSATAPCNPIIRAWSTSPTS
jgi:cytochrome P450